MNSRYTDLAMDQREFITHSPEETVALGRTLVELLTPPEDCAVAW